MKDWAQYSVDWLLLTLALPKVGLSAVFAVSMLSATILPVGSEPAVFGFVKLAPDMFWPAVLVAAAGNTIGGIVTYWMGVGAEKAYVRWREKHGHHDHASTGHMARLGGRWHIRINQWAHRLGPPVLFFAWLPVVGDPLCAVAGWLRLSFWPSVFYMAAGKLLRYVALTGALMWVFPNLP